METEREREVAALVDLPSSLCCGHDQQAKKLIGIYMTTRGFF